MWKSILRDRKLLILFFIALAIRLFSVNELWVESYYTYGVYPHLSAFLRILFGWIPFSLGDLAYLLAFVWLVYKTWKLLRLLAKRQLKEYLSHVLFRKYLRLVLWIYIVFNLFWGLNYNRQGIAHQLGLNVQRYQKEEIVDITNLLLQQVNKYAALVDTNQRDQLDESGILFRQAIQDYRKVDSAHRFLWYPHPSLKPSLYSYFSHYFGFTGYFNPFTSEAQISVDEPMFIKPFIIRHEIAHQLGYGKENEASFVSYLACRQSADVHTRYSVYYELFVTAFRECALADSVVAKKIKEQLNPRVIRDKAYERQWRQQRKNVFQPLVSDFYDSYLRMNNQPQGIATYNEVIAWLIAYRKKFGAAAI